MVESKELFLADIALVITLSGKMSLRVYFKGVTGRETLVAMLALERSTSCVRVAVLLQSNLATEPPRTVRAEYRLGQVVFTMLPQQTR